MSKIKERFFQECSLELQVPPPLRALPRCCFGNRHKPTMFSSLFGKRRSSPIEDDTPPIPGAKTDDGFEIVNPTSPRGGLYPNVSGMGGPAAPLAPYPQRPAPPAPVPAFRPNVDTFHYLQGVPFTLCKELQMASNKDGFTREISDLLSFLTAKLNMSSYDYDFNTERSVLKEC